MNNMIIAWWVQVQVQAGYRSRGKQRGYYRKKKSIRRRINNGDHGMRPRFQEGRDSSTSQPKFNFNAQKKFHYLRNNIALPNNKQRHHPVVPVKEDGGHTTVMIRNIPNRLTRDMLMDFLDDHCKFENQKAKQLIQIHNGDAEAGPIIVSAFDFLYLPMDFKSGMNKGFAFVNFTDPKAAWKFYLSAQNLSWVAFHSDKILQIASARLQGRAELESHFERTNFACDGKQEYLPVCLSPARDARWFKRDSEPPHCWQMHRQTSPKSGLINRLDFVVDACTCMMHGLDVMVWFINYLC